MSGNAGHDTITKNTTYEHEKHDPCIATLEAELKRLEEEIRFCQNYAKDRVNLMLLVFGLGLPGVLILVTQANFLEVIIPIFQTHFFILLICTFIDLVFAFVIVEIWYFALLKKIEPIQPKKLYKNKKQTSNLTNCSLNCFEILKDKLRIEINNYEKYKTGAELINILFFCILFCIGIFISYLILYSLTT